MVLFCPETDLRSFVLLTNDYVRDRSGTYRVVSFLSPLPCQSLATIIYVCRNCKLLHSGPMHTTISITMKKYLLAVGMLFSIFSAFSQDTTWVQTFTFDTIETRRANFEFSASLDNKRFEKVLMYYKLKCSPLTTWDQYNCGEWDYLAYTRIFDHTGILDSVRVNGMHYAINTQTPVAASYNSVATVDQQWKNVLRRTPVSGTVYPVSGTTATPMAIVSSGVNGKTIQWVISASELMASGATTGDLQALELSFLDALAGLQNVKIRLKSTSASTLTTWETAGFTTVFDDHLSAVAAGSYSMNFSSPFFWDGTSNLIIELSYADANTSFSAIELETQESTVAGSVSEYTGHNGVFRTTATNYAEVNLSEVDLGGDVSIAFWAKGNGSYGTNTSILEAVDSANNRILNIHMPWSDNTIYFDAGNQNGYDRISKASQATDIDNVWHHWVFVKKASTGEMFIYKDGIQWHTGTGLTRQVGKITRFVLGSNIDQGYQYKGDIDEFSVWTTALDAATIATWKDRKIDATHPDYASLEVYYDFDNVRAAVDQSGNNRLAMCSEDGMINWDEYPVSGRISGSVRPKTGFVQGSYNAAQSDSVLMALFPQPKVLFTYAAGDNSFIVTQNNLIFDDAALDTLYSNGNTHSSAPVTLSQTITNDTITYYKPPFEIVNDVEIGRYITPYGIGFDLGPQGFTWIYDVTDYQQYLNGMVDLAAHNTQELIDLKFAFIEGTPPRDVHNIEPIWSNFRSYQYSDMDNDNVLAAQQVILSDTSETFKIKTRFTGHGHNGSVNCCEWDPKDHQIIVDGIPRFTWDIWEESACGENPNIGQGGTWPYAREGWCPGDMVKEYDHELTPYVTSGDTVTIDYDIEDIPVNDQAQGNGNYVMAMDLVSYSAPNFQHDAAIVDVLNPNKWEYYSKWNPTCSNPRVILQNTGEQPLTKCTIRCWVTYGNWLEYEWTGNLAFLEKEIVEIPVTDQNWWFGADPATQQFHAQVHSVEGTPDLDEYAQNNVFKTFYQAPEVITGPFFVWFTTNNKANENQWKLIDGNGTTIFERTTLTNSTNYRDTFDLAPGCYSIILEDSDHDGISFWYSSQVEGESGGQFRLRYVAGGVVENFPGDFGKYHRYDFSVGFALNNEEHGMMDEELQLYPNPASDHVQVEFNGNLGTEVTVTLMDANGREVRTVVTTTQNNYFGTEIQVNDLEKGLYFIQASGTNGTIKSKFLKQ